MYEIQPNIPIPKKGDKYRFSEMQIGDSFPVPLKEISTVRGMVLKYKKQNPDFNYITRRILDKDGNFKELRIWREAVNYVDKSTL